MSTAECPRCKELIRLTGAETIICPGCGLALRAPPPAPQAPQKPTAEVKQAAARGISRGMLVCTLLWVGVMILTFFLVIAKVALRDHHGRETPEVDVVAIVLGSICYWFFETMVYGVVMIVLWVVRLNVKE